MSLLRACKYCVFNQITYCLDLVHTLCLQGSPCAAQQEWSGGWRKEKEGFLPKEKEGFLEARFCAHVLFECKPLVGAAQGSRQYEVSRSCRLCQDNSSTSSGCDGNQRSTEPPHLCVIFPQAVYHHTLPHVDAHAQHSWRCLLVRKISNDSCRGKSWQPRRAGMARQAPSCILPVWGCKHLHDCSASW